MTCSLLFVVLFLFVFSVVAVLFILFLCFLVDTFTSIKLVDEPLVQSELPKCLHVKTNQAKNRQKFSQDVTGVKKGISQGVWTTYVTRIRHRSRAKKATAQRSALHRIRGVQHSPYNSSQSANPPISLSPLDSFIHHHFRVTFISAKPQPQPRPLLIPSLPFRFSAASILALCFPTLPDVPFRYQFATHDLRPAISDHRATSDQRNHDSAALLRPSTAIDLTSPPSSSRR